MAQLTYSNYSPAAVDNKIFCARPKVVYHVGLATPTEKKNTFSIDTWHDLSQKARLVTLGFQDQRESSRDRGFENP